MDLLEFFNQFGPNTIYIVMFVVFLATGFGLPLPEDVPLTIAGYLCGIAPGQPPYFWIMLPVCMTAIVGSDTVLYFFGRRYGVRAKKLPVIRRLLSPRQLMRAESRIREHGGKFVFAARFLPGLRTPAFFVAGTSKVPLSRFFLYDGLAAAISVPTILGLAYVFAEELEHVRQLIARGELVATSAAVLAVVAFVVFQVRAGKRRKSRLTRALAQRWLRKRHGKAAVNDHHAQRDAAAQARREPAPRFGGAAKPEKPRSPDPDDDAEAA
ncbi:MAG: DedA family protein [Planctomycetota bacterium]